MHGAAIRTGDGWLAAEAMPGRADDETPTGPDRINPYNLSL